ncbi:MAG TPA: YhcH/YjgK/YiaL family protein [Bacteroidales bacterium]|nr:YhcH/YjgK/YiaL family protein [Bacteroidales bacterium]
MKTSLFKIMVLASLFGLFGCGNSSDPSKWNEKQVNSWFEKGEWLNGWNVKPDASVNKKEFAVSYFRHKERWDKAFLFLKDNNLGSLELKRHDIDGNNVYAPVSEYLTKNEEDARYEAHRKYADIQYVVSGRELIGIIPADQQKDILEPYNPDKDIMFMTVNKIVNYPAQPDRFFIFFPGDLHRPGLKDGENSQVRKVVVKVLLD